MKASEAKMKPFCKISVNITCNSRHVELQDKTMELEGNINRRVKKCSVKNVLMFQANIIQQWWPTIFKYLEECDWKEKCEKQFTHFYINRYSTHILGLWGIFFNYYFFLLVRKWNSYVLLIRDINMSFFIHSSKCEQVLKFMYYMTYLNLQKII